MSEPLLAPRLSADFADRVLDRADRQLRRQRRERWIIAATACLCLMAIAVGVLPRWAQLPRPSALPRETTPVANSPAESSEIGAAPSNTLSYLFPDAEPLSRFAAEDDGADRNSGAEALFDDQD